MWRVILAAPTWALYLIIDLIVYLIGWILVPIAAAAGAYEKSLGHDGAGTPRDVYHFTWKFMFPWDNWEDGIANDTYIKYPTMFRQIIYWSCQRNPTNNLRITPILSVKIDPAKVRFVGDLDDPKLYDTDIPQWFFAWHGLYSNYYTLFVMKRTVKIPFTSIGFDKGDLVRFWIGWKVMPADIDGVSTYRVPGAGFALQLKTIAEGVNK